MCKLSRNIVPNVYNSMQSSFLSLAWPWPGRSLPKGNQWEWWDPGKEPLPGPGEVGHSPRGTSGSAGTLDWGPIWSGSQSTCQPNISLHPLTPLHPWRASNSPLYHLYPSGLWVNTFPASPHYTPDTPTPWCPLLPLMASTPPIPPRRPQCLFMLPIHLLAPKY